MKIFLPSRSRSSTHPASMLNLQALASYFIIIPSKSCYWLTVYDKVSGFCAVHGSLHWPQGQYQHFTCTSSIAACNSQLLPTNQICELLSYPKKTKNPNPSPIGNRFGFFLFGGRGWITRAAHLKKPRRGFFPRRTVRRVDAVRIHPLYESGPVTKQKPQRTCIR